MPGQTKLRTTDLKAEAHREDSFSTSMASFIQHHVQVELLKRGSPLLQLAQLIVPSLGSRHRTVLSRDTTHAAALTEKLADRDDDAPRPQPATYTCCNDKMEMFWLKSYDRYDITVVR